MTDNPPCQLYLITPPRIDVAAFAGQLKAALDGGEVAALQLRLKDVPDTDILKAGEALMPVCHEYGANFIVNDRPDLARRLDADGVHVGQRDASCAEAREILGDGKVVGVTCHDSRHLAMTAAEAGADYVAFGAFFPTKTKEARHHPSPEILEIWSESMEVPSVAIGGVTPENCKPLASAGADFLAVVSAVWDHADGPGAAVSEFNRICIS